MSTRIIALSAGTAMAMSTIAATAGAVPQRTTTPQATQKSAAATPSENAKLNKVKTPNLSWFNCYGSAQCAKVKVPLDYDNPKGKTTNVAVLRTPATGKRIGTLFVNPGGPGGSSTELAHAADNFLSPEVRKNFDVVGVDPRGVGFSDRVECLPVEEQQDALKDLRVGVPYGWLEQQKYINASKKFAKACSKNSLATSMSTAEVARDMEMVRRGLGKGKLNFIGFSYGSHLGNTYANMFPANFRSIVVDGVLDPVAWSGTKKTASKPLDARIISGEGAWKAMDKILKECGVVGPERCSFADGGDPKAKFTKMANQLKKGPVTITDPFSDETFELTYGDFVSTLLNALYDSDAPVFASDLLYEFEYLLNEGGPSVGRAKTSEERATLKRVYEALQEEKSGPRRGFDYNNSLDSFLSVTCTDSMETTKINDYHQFARDSDAKAPHFGRAWLWGSAACAGDSFTGEDDDTYVGPFDRYTPKAVLVVGNYWDPATNYQGAVDSRKVLGRSRLISSDSWGHTAYGISECVTQRVDQYLISGTGPQKDATCAAESEMFPAESEELSKSAPQILAEHELPKAPKGKAFPEPKSVR